MPTKTRLTKAQKRVAIAKDVLKQLKALNVVKGTYLRNYGLQLPRNDQAKQHINQISRGCEVCALGACFLSHIRLFNEVDVGTLAGRCGETVNCVFAGSDLIDAELHKYFTYDQLLLIEAAFEGWTGEGYEARDFYDKHPDPKERLQAIMQNIVKNNGEFKL
jgi:hypothetical protein